MLDTVGKDIDVCPISTSPEDKCTCELVVAVTILLGATVHFVKSPHPPPNTTQDTAATEFGC